MSDQVEGAERREAFQSKGGGAGVSPESKRSARDESHQVPPRPANPKKRTDRRPKRAHDAAVARAFFVPAVAACSFRSMFGAVRGYQMASARPGRRRIGVVPRLEMQMVSRAFLRTFGKARPPQMSRQDRRRRERKGTEEGTEHFVADLEVARERYFDLIRTRSLSAADVHTIMLGGMLDTLNVHMAAQWPDVPHPLAIVNRDFEVLRDRNSGDVESFAGAVLYAALFLLATAKVESNQRLPP